MKIEKINDNQIKFVLNHEDLQEWNLKITELTYGSERTQELFREMMEQALAECDFRVDNAPLLIEAIPQALDTIIIIVTKVVNSGEVDERYLAPPLSKVMERFKAKPMLEERPVTVKNDPLSVFSFDSLDDVILAAPRLKAIYEGSNSLFKCEGRFYLLLHHEPSPKLPVESLDAVLCEYGQKHPSNTFSKYYLQEHGELIIDDKAVEVLAAL